MKKLLTLPLLAMLAACSGAVSEQEAAQRAYVYTVNTAVLALDGANAYGEDCLEKKPKGHECYQRVKKADPYVQTLRGAVKQATKAIVSEDSKYYDIQKSTLENLMGNIKRILKEEEDEQQ